MAELIAFLIEHFQDFDACPPTPDLGHFLEEVGFDEVEVGNALMLLTINVSVNSSTFFLLRQYIMPDLPS